MKMNFIIHPLFIVFAGLLVYLNYFVLLISYLITIILHEFAHAIVAAKLGYKLNRITLMPHGASLSGESRFFCSRDEILVAIAGPACNLVLAVLGCAVWWIFPMTYAYTQVFVYANLCTAVINCLPVFPLDGGRVLYALLCRKKDKKSAIKKVRILGIAVSCCIIIAFFVTMFFVPNFTLLVFGAFLLLTSIMEDKHAYYSQIGILESKSSHLARGLKMRSLAVPSDMPLFRLISTITPDSLTEFTVIDNEYKVLWKINERDLQKLLQIYPANTALKLIVT